MANPFAIGGALEITYGLLAVAFAVVVYNVDPKNPVNRTLAMLLLVDGATSGGLVLGASRFAEGESTVRALTAVAYIGNGARPWLYLAFIATAMPFAWTRLIDRTNGRRTLYAMAAAAGLVCGLFGLRHGWIKDSFQLAFILIGLLGFASAVLAYRRAAGDRHKTRAYLSAFAVRDVGAGLLLPFRDLAADGTMLQGWLLVAVKVVYVVFILLVVYGVLWGQIVDLDRRARITFGRTVAATVVATAFIAITGAVENWFGVDDPIVAISVSVAVAFSFQPIQNWSERAAKGMFPGEPVAAKDYAEAVRGAVADGDLARREKDVLTELVERRR